MNFCFLYIKSKEISFFNILKINEEVILYMRREFVLTHTLEIVIFTREVETLAFGSNATPVKTTISKQASKYVMYVLIIEAYRFMRHDKVCYYQLSISWSLQAVLCTKFSEAKCTC